MKTLRLWCLVLVGMLALGGIGYASSEPMATKDIKVSATVQPYAEFYDFTAESLHLNFVGKGGEHLYPGLKFKIRSNTPIKVIAGFSPLTHKSDPQYGIRTGLRLSPHDGTYKYKLAINEYLDPGAPYTEFTSRFNPLQEVEDIPYYLQAMATLGDVHHQAAGDYETEFILTIVAAD